METIASLIRKYNDFWEDLSRSEWKEYFVPLSPQDPATRQEVDHFAVKNGLPIPDDIKEFWCTPLIHGLLRPISESIFAGSWLAGCDWHSLVTVQEWHKIGLQSSNQWREEQKDDLPYQLTLNGSYPQWVLNTFPRRGKAGIYCRNADYILIEEVVAPTFTEFFRHWLAAGCFTRGNSDAYLRLVHDRMPLRIPPEQNRWLQFCNKYKT